MGLQTYSFMEIPMHARTQQEASVVESMTHYLAVKGVK